jgi:hypothetical protein
MKETLIYLEENDKLKKKPKKKGFFHLSYKERLGAFIFLNIIGYILQWGSWENLFNSIFDEAPGHFAFLYSFGNILSLLGTFIYCGFKDHVKTMTHESRKWVSIIFLCSVTFSLIVPFFWKTKTAKFFITLAIIVQMISYWIYTLSFFPHLQMHVNMLCKYFCSCFFKSRK